MTNRDADVQKSLEELDGERWGEPPAGSTGLVCAVHSLRKRPIGSLGATELARLIGQNVGTRWLLPLAVSILREDAPGQARGGFYDDDLLSAVLTCPPSVWDDQPRLLREMKQVLRSLVDLSVYVQEHADRFLAQHDRES